MTESIIKEQVLLVANSVGSNSQNHMSSNCPLVDFPNLQVTEGLFPPVFYAHPALFSPTQPLDFPSSIHLHTHTKKWQCQGEWGGEGQEDKAGVKQVIQQTVSPTSCFKGKLVCFSVNGTGPLARTIRRLFAPGSGPHFTEACEPQEGLQSHRTDLREPTRRLQETSTTRAYASFTGCSAQ